MFLLPQPGDVMRCIFFGCLCALAVAIPSVGRAQAATANALTSWISLYAPPGDEHVATDAIARGDQRWRRDQLGNLILRRGSGRPRRVVACGLDAPGFVVSEITERGYLRLHRAGRTPRHPLWDQFHEAQQVKIFGRLGPVSGVVAVPNAHFARQHRGDTMVVNVDMLWVDVGARDRADVEALGIRLLDPVLRDWPEWSYGEYVAGPDASSRIGCAAIAAAATSDPAGGETIFVLSSQRNFGYTGLNAALSRLGAVDDVALVIPHEQRGSAATTPVRRRRVARPSFLSRAPLDSVVLLDVRAAFDGSLVESVRLSDADSLLAEVARVAGVSVRRAWVPVASGEETTGRASASELDSAAALLASLADVHGPPEHEWAVRAAVRDAMPAWAKGRAVQDSIGNLVLAMGPDRDTLVFIAHMDEVGFAVTGIRGDGSVTLEQRGGVIPSAWEGQPALVHFDPAPGRAQAAPPLPGVFTPRDSATLRRPAAVTAWFGLDSAALVARGVRVGLGVTAYKRARRLGATRFTARSLDDRAGSTALLLALRDLDHTKLTRKVIFAWSVQEEGGLDGARFLAGRVGRSVRSTYSIDTFVSSDTPLESPHFAFAPLGKGAVLRGLDDGSISPAAERRRIEELARRAAIPLQIGTTHGATDGTEFTRVGSPNTGLSWPGRYSHSPVEVLDLRDLVALAKLIGVVVRG